MTTHSRPPTSIPIPIPIPKAQSPSTNTYAAHRIHTRSADWECEGGRAGGGLPGSCVFKVFMQRCCFFTYRVASSVRRCVGVVGGSGSMGNNGRRRSMAASCFQLVLDA